MSESRVSGDPAYCADCGEYGVVVSLCRPCLTRGDEHFHTKVAALQARVTELEEELARKAGDWPIWVGELQAKLFALETENERLKEYARHKKGCSVVTGASFLSKCSCGYASLTDAAKEKS